MIGMGTRRFVAAGTNIPPYLPTTALVVVRARPKLVLACRAASRSSLDSARRAATKQFSES
jgi:hypothetical protein